MNCPNCENPCGEQDAFCIHCGAPLTQPAQKQGSHLPPILAMVGLSLLGLIVYFATTV